MGNPEIGKTAVSGDYFLRRDAKNGWNGNVSVGGDGVVSEKRTGCAKFWLCGFGKCKTRDIKNHQENNHIQHC